MKNPKISVVTVTWNAAPLLAATIESVSKQDYGNIEYVVVDGNSSDSSIDVIKSSKTVSEWVSEPDKGIYDAMNKAARIATGEWIIFLNAGDTFASDDVLSRLADAVEDGIDVIYGDVIRGQGPDGIMKQASDTLKGHRLAFCHQSVMVRRELQLKFPFDISHKYSADFKFFKTLFKNGASFRHVNFPVARFDTSGISTRRRSAGIADNMKVIREVDGTVAGIPYLLHLLPTYIISRIRGK